MHFEHIHGRLIAVLNIPSTTVQICTKNGCRVRYTTRAMKNIYEALMQACIKHATSQALTTSDSIYNPSIEPAYQRQLRYGFQSVFAAGKNNTTFN